MSIPITRACLLLLLGLLLLPPGVWAAPVSWIEVPPTAEGRQWWDAGSLHYNRAGHLTVLSRFQSAPSLEAQASASQAGPLSPAAAPPATAPRGNDGPDGASRPAGAPGSAPGEAAAAPALDSATNAGNTTSHGPAGSLPAGLDRRAGGSGATSISRLYVMELDCDQSLYRDISVNGLPRFGATWQPTGSDDLTAEVLRQACAAEAP